MGESFSSPSVTSPAAPPAADPLAVDGIGDLLTRALGALAQQSPILGQLVQIAADPDVGIVLSGLAKNAYAEVVAKFKSGYDDPNMSPAARIVYMRGLTPAMRDAVTRRDRAAVAEVLVEEAKLDEAAGKVGRVVVRHLVVAILDAAGLATHA